MKNKFVLYAGYCLAGIIAFTAISCGGKENKQAAKAQKALPFPVTKAEKRDVTTYSTYPTRLQGEVSSEVRPKVAGYIQDVLVDEGQEVKAGQLLFRLETQSLSQDAAAAKANVNAAQVEVDKLKPLVEKNIISSVQLETAKAKLKQAESNLSAIQANIGYANVKSPVNGIIGKINYRKGALVSAQDPLPITTVSAIKNVYAYFSLNEKDFLDFMTENQANTNDLSKLPEVSLVLANGKDYPHKGKIETISGSIDKQTGTVTFRAKFKNDNNLLRDGASGKVLLPVPHKNATVIPIASTFEQQGKTFVYEVLKDSLVVKPVSVTTEAGKIYVIEDFEEGTTILGSGLNKVRPGTKITPIPTPLDSIINSFNTVFK